MSKGMGLLFAFIGTALLASISWFIAAGQALMAALAGVVTILFLGAGFILKARMRRKKG